MKNLPPAMDGVKDRATFMLAAVFLVLGIILDNRMEESSIGTVFIAVGGLFLIITMALRRKRKEDPSKTDDNE